MSEVNLTLQHFLPYVGEAFTLTCDGHSEALTLETAEATANPSSLRPGGDFRLVFKGESTDILLQQHIFGLTHPAMGALSLFLVPLRRNPDGTHSYGAAFG